MNEGSAVPWLSDETVAVVDFETTGMGPAHGARATEVAVVLVRGGRVVDQYASLMHTGVPVPPFIERLTGISNDMLDKAPGAREVMAEVAARTNGCPMVAHNASFDRGFWVDEMRRAGVDASATPFTCTVKLARRLYPQAPNCKLGTLAAFHSLQAQGRAHRALADALVTAQLWQRIGTDAHALLAEPLAGAPLSVTLLHALQSVPQRQWPRLAQASRRQLAQGALLPFEELAQPV
jgi:DNA polymerase-3 subunit epsilon